ncbi:S1C family serine protease, partial [Agrococcus sp. HG114]|uniref:S1C family serine protease n=1 Tax=Agrococcus sp. HG114 TaxID=2969757 RepID=UPI00215B1BEB
AALLGGAAGFGGGALAAQQSAPQTQSAPTSGDVSAAPVSDPATIADVAASAGPSVVTVQASSNAGSGEGSGVVVAAGGYIVTNNHVVTLDGQSADASITVETQDGRLLAAEIVGTDPVVDLAVLRVDEELPVVTFASSDDVRVGDTAVAIGAPLGLSNSVTDGIVSAVDRGLRIASSAAPDDDQQSQQSPFGFWQEDGAQAAQEDISIPVVQTDASINPGNSGGALLNASGQLIGVNVAIASMGQGQASGSIGIGFAIEASLVQRVVEEIIATGEATHGLLGATVSDVRDASVGTVGAQIRELSDGGAAAAAGLQPGDVITEIEGAAVTNAVDATAQVRAHAAGATVTVTYQRGGERAEAEVTLGQLP